jgi:ubiquinone/menaquinone biosynthesis C-methylase UbiE
MSTPFDRRVNDNPSTYVVQDRKNKKELTRLTVQDQVATASMGGVLPEQADPTAFHRVLDVACGTGGWIIEAAQTYPAMSLVGIDISQRMIEYACAQSKVHQVNDRVEFHVMDVLQTLEFLDASFDLVNLRFGFSFVRTWDWPKLLTELLRVTRPGGVLRITDTETIPQSNSSALMCLMKMFQCALYRAGRLFTEEPMGFTSQLAPLLSQYGCEQVQTKAYAVEYQAGTEQGKAYSEDQKLMFQTTRPFIQKWNCASQDYDVIYQQVVKEMSQPDFHAVWDILTVWGNKLGPRSKQL